MVCDFKLFNGDCMGFVGEILGGSKAPPVVSSAPASDVSKAATKAKKQRSALLQTEGGIVGQELTAGQVGRNTLFGN